jgi:hypothetical protein
MSIFSKILVRSRNRMSQLTLLASLVILLKPRKLSFEYGCDASREFHYIRAGVLRMPALSNPGSIARSPPTGMVLINACESLLLGLSLSKELPDSDNNEPDSSATPQHDRAYLSWLRGHAYACSLLELALETLILQTWPRKLFQSLQQRYRTLRISIGRFCRPARC